jgi:hypothetical protein
MTDSAPQVSQVSEASEPMTHRQLTLLFLTAHIFFYGLLAFIMTMERDETMFILTASLTAAAILASLIVFMLPKRFLKDAIPRNLEKLLNFPN